MLLECLDDDDDVSFAFNDLTRVDSGFLVVTNVQKRTLEDNVYKLSFILPWVFLPLCCWIVTTTEGAGMIFVKEIALSLAVVLVGKVLQRGSYGNKRKAAALMFGVNVASIGWLVGSVPAFAEGIWSTRHYAVFAVSVFLMCYCLYKTAVTDPGVVFTSYGEKIHVRASCCALSLKFTVLTIVSIVEHSNTG